MKAWLPVDVDIANIQKYIQDSDWIAEEKYDGKRLFLHTVGEPPNSTTTKYVVAYNRDGETTTLPSGITRSFQHVRPGTILDGEWLDRQRRYVAFDILVHAGVDFRSDPLVDRKVILQAVFSDIEAPVVLAPFFTKTPEKLELLTRLHRERAEGVILKRATAPYVGGRPGTMLRLKFRRRCDVIVQRRPADTKKSFEMYVYSHDGEIVHVGSVSARHFYDLIAPNGVAVAEIEYLYSTPDQRLYQPVLIRMRTDKRSVDCTTDQLVLGKRFSAAC